MKALAGDVMAAGSVTQPTPEGSSPAESPAELARPPVDVWEIPFALSDLTELRELVGAWAIREAMDSERAERLVLAVHELATNSIRHGGGVGMLRLWRDGQTLMCEVQDAGHIKDPLIGRVNPGTDPRRGRGLWIANTVCDLVQIRSSPRGSRVRLHMGLA
jgi:anti-sigma regulatory factor (Ser/Thr protein kinase)